MKKITFGRIFIIIALTLIVLFLAGCNTGENQTGVNGNVPGGNDNKNGSDSTSETSTGSNDNQDTGTDPLVVAQQEWELSPHSSTYVVDDQNQNNTCARCHAPVNWMPTLDDIPESCQVCKFELEDPPPFISENDWAGITCLFCHKENKKGEIQPEVLWLEIPALEEYAEVETYSELCLKCHDSNNNPEHGAVIVGGDHAGMSCTDCHPPHNATATCDSTDCHPNVLEADATPGHDEDHQTVACVGCHDSAGWEIGYDTEKELYMTLGPWSYEHIIAEGDSIIESGLVLFSSHEISKEADCTRCHFAGNEWNLTVDVDTP
jgi:hypothetical protein